MKNIELFNLFAGKVFADLYERFPRSAQLSPRSMAMETLGSEASLRVDIESVVLHQIDLEKVDPDTVPKVATLEFYEYTAIASATIRWLLNCDYIRIDGPRPSEEHIPDRCHFVLSPKALEVLAAVPSSLTFKESLGSQLAETSKDIASESAKSTIAELVGKVLGAALGLPSG
jgi:hypothetical protein